MIVKGGYCGRLLRIDLTSRRITTEAIEAATARKFIGGRGLASHYLAREVDPAVDPLSPANKLLLATGPLTGSGAPAPGRFMAVTKGPLTGAIASSNCGGYWGPELKFAGYDMVIVEGKAPGPVWVSIRRQDVAIHDAAGLWGKLVGQTTDALLAEFGDPKARVLCIGPAGEAQGMLACIMCDRYRAAGRSGVGAVMGSKNLKAVVVRGSGRVEPARDEQAADVLKAVRRKIKDNAVTGQTLPTYGTAALVNVINECGIYPTRNFQSGYFPRADGASGEALAEKYLTGKDICFRCQIACGRYCRADDVEGGGPEYETVWAYSADCGVGDLAAVIKANHWCNEYGLDTIGAGATIACAMELFEKGHIPPAEVDGPPLRFGSTEAIVEWTRKMGAGEGFGARLALGSYRLAEMYGHPELSMTVKRQELPAYDPRGAQGHGLEYATSNRGGCHVRGYLISAEVLGIPEKLDPLTTADKAVWVKAFQDLTAAIDSLGVCLFTSFALRADDYRDLFNAFVGEDWTTGQLLTAGERIWNLERSFNLRAGISPAQDTLPPRLLKEALTRGGPAGHVHRLADMLPEYYALRGWGADGVPTEAKLAELALV